MKIFLLILNLLVLIDCFDQCFANVEIEVQKNKFFDIPIYLNYHQEINGINIKVKFDDSVIQFFNTNIKGGILEDITNQGYISYNPPIVRIGENEIEIGISAGGENLVKGSGIILFITMKATGAINHSSTISLNTFNCDENPAIGGFYLNNSFFQKISIKILQNCKFLLDKISLEDAIYVLEVMANVKKNDSICFIDFETSIQILQIISEFNEHFLR